MTEIHAHAKPRLMGRKKLWEERLNLPLAKGAKAALAAALLPGEETVDLARAALDRELQRRGHDVMPPPANEPPVKKTKAD